jgi:hypothetical protein
LLIEIVASFIGTVIPLTALYYVAYRRGLKRGVAMGVDIALEGVDRQFLQGNIMFRRRPKPVDGKRDINVN